MKDLLVALLTLRDFDVKIIDLKAEREKYPREIAQLTQKRIALAKEFEEFSSQFKSLQLKKTSLEKDIESNIEMIRKYDTQLMGVKDNDSYKALQKEIAGLKEKNRNIEDEILLKMEDLDRVHKEVEEKKSELKAKEEDLKAKEKECQVEGERLDREIAEWIARRKEKLQHVSPNALLVYERILSKTKDFAIARIEKEKCSGCHMRLSPQFVVETMSARELMLCPNCSRIVYCAQTVGETVS